jgi:hypothetical protein
MPYKLFLPCKVISEFSRPKLSYCGNFCRRKVITVLVIAYVAYPFHTGVLGSETHFGFIVTYLIWRKKINIFSFKFHTKCSLLIINIVRLDHFHKCYMPRPSYPPYLVNTTNHEAPHYVIFSILLLLPLSLSLSLMSKYPSQHPVLKHPQSVFFP